MQVKFRKIVFKFVNFSMKKKTNKQKQNDDEQEAMIINRIYTAGENQFNLIND